MMHFIESTTEALPRHTSYSGFVFQGSQVGKCKPWDIHMHAMFRNPSEPWRTHLKG
ncbi:hypothetical protein Dimus_003666 [Dionaea muscipula]